MEFKYLLFYSSISPFCGSPIDLYHSNSPLPKIFILYISNIYSKNRMEAWGFCNAEKKQERYKKCGSHMMINHDIETVREFSVHDSKKEFFELSMGRLNWNGNRQPKLSYKSERLERLFLQLMKEKLTNPEKFLQLSYLKILNSPYLLPLLEFPSLNISFKELWEEGGLF